MSSFRRLYFLHNGDYFVYEDKIYKVDWTLEEPYNVIRVKTGKSEYIEEYIKVKWLRNYKNLAVV